MENKDRSEEYQRNPDLELALNEINRVLSEVEPQFLKQTEFSHDPIFVVGCARSGTTLFMQLMAASGVVAYPSNFISRFYEAPVLASKMQYILHELDATKEVFGDKNFTFDSDLGKTEGPLSPHEFWYFWRRFFQFDEVQEMSETQLTNVDTKKFLRELVGMTHVFSKPFCMKAMILNWHIEFLAQLIPNARFVYVKREDVFNAQSLLLARERFFGTRERWYSFKPPEYDGLKDKSPCRQVGGQVAYTNMAIEAGLSRIESNRWCTVQYSDMCNDPEQTLTDLFNSFGLTVSDQLNVPKNFANQNKVNVNSQDFDVIKQAINQYSVEHVSITR